MFEGYEDELLHFVPEHDVIPMDRFGWFYQVGYTLSLCHILL